MAERLNKKARVEIEADDAAEAARPMKRLSREAFDAGAAARGAGRACEPPTEFAQHRPLARTWIEGWESAAPRAPMPEIVHREPPMQTRALPPQAFWPQDKPLPTKFQRPPVPCVRCKRLLTDDGRRAAVLKFTKGDVAYFRCQASEMLPPAQRCPDFKLPIER